MSKDFDPVRAIFGAKINKIKLGRFRVFLVWHVYPHWRPYLFRTHIVINLGRFQFAFYWNREA